MNNYPPGAASDPLAPYNQPLDEDVEVTVEETFTSYFILQVPKHKYALRHWEEDLPEYYKDQCITLSELIERSKYVCEMLLKAEVSSVGKVSIRELLKEFNEWTFCKAEITEV